MSKQLALIAMAVMSTLLALVALWQFRIVIVYVLISLLIAATFRTIRKSESRRRYRMRLGIGLRYLVGFVVAALLIFVVGRFLAADIQRLIETLSTDTAWMLPEWLLSGSSQRTFFKWFPTPNQLFDALISNRQLVLSAALGITQGIGGIIGGLVIIIFLSIYWSINQNHFERLWLSLLPADMRKRARYISRTIETDLGAYTRSELIQFGLAVFLLGLGYWLVGSPYPMLLAVAGAIAWLIPVVGAALAIILPLLLGLLTGTQPGIILILYTVLVMFALQLWVEPRLFKLKWDNPVLTFVVLLAMADAFGVLGIIAAPPVSVVCQILWKFLVTDNLSATIGVSIADLKEQQMRLQESIGSMPGPPPPLVESSMTRLAELLEKAEPILDGTQPAQTPEVFRPIAK